ncbi:hypothetical protein GEMRC1_007389 [Eukaryota sp. GEM-RC1]
MSHRGGTNTNRTRYRSQSLSFPPRIRQLLHAYFKNAKNCLSITEFLDSTLVAVNKQNKSERDELFNKLVDLHANICVGCCHFPSGYETLFTALSKPINNETGSSIFVLPGQVRLTSPNPSSLSFAHAAVEHRVAQMNCQTRAHVLFIHVPRNSPRRFKFEPHPSAPDDLRLVSLPEAQDSEKPCSDAAIFPGAHIHSLIVLADLNDPDHMRSVLKAAFELANGWDSSVVQRSANSNSATPQKPVTDGSASLSSRVQHLMFYCRKNGDEGNQMSKSALMRQDISTQELVQLLQDRTLDYTIKHPHPSEFSGIIRSTMDGSEFNDDENEFARLFGLGYVANLPRSYGDSSIDPNDRCFSRIQHWFSLSPDKSSIKDTVVILPTRPNIAMDFILPHSYGVGSLQLRFHFNTRLPTPPVMSHLHEFVNDAHSDLLNVMKATMKQGCYAAHDLTVTDHLEPGIEPNSSKLPLPPRGLSQVFERIVESSEKVKFYCDEESPETSKKIRIHKSMGNTWKDSACDWLLETRDVGMTQEGLVVLHNTNTNSPDQRQEAVFFTKIWDNFGPLDDVEQQRLENFVSFGSSPTLSTIMSAAAQPFAGSYPELLNDQSISDVKDFLSDTMNVLCNYHQKKEALFFKKRVNLRRDSFEMDVDDDSFFCFTLGNN